jgi:hypothetical protein
MINSVNKYLSKVDFETEFKKDKIRLTIFISIEILFIFLTLLIQEYLRPNVLLNSKMGIFMMGVLPSFFGAAAYVLIAFVCYKIVQGHYQKYKLTTGLIIANSFTFFGLTIWELVRVTMYSFDWWDMIATIFGCFLSTIVIFFTYIFDKKELN